MRLAFARASASGISSGPFFAACCSRTRSYSALISAMKRVAASSETRFWHTPTERLASDT